MKTAAPMVPATTQSRRLFGALARRNLDRGTASGGRRYSSCLTISFWIWFVRDAGPSSAEFWLMASVSWSSGAIVESESCTVLAP